MYTSTNTAIRTLHIYAHIIDVSDGDRHFVALRSLRLCGGIHNSALQPKLHDNRDFQKYVRREVERVSDTFFPNHLNSENDTSLFAMAVRTALASTFSHHDRANGDGGTTHKRELGKCSIRRIHCNSQPHRYRHNITRSPLAGMRSLKSSKAPSRTTNALSTTKKSDVRRANPQTHLTR